MYNSLELINVLKKKKYNIQVIANGNLFQVIKYKLQNKQHGYDY